MLFILRLPVRWAHSFSGDHFAFCYSCMLTSIVVFWIKLPLLLSQRWFISRLRTYNPFLQQTYAVPYQSEFIRIVFRPGNQKPRTHLLTLRSQLAVQHYPHITEIYVAQWSTNWSNFQNKVLVGAFIINRALLSLCIILTHFTDTEPDLAVSKSINDGSRTSPMKLGQYQAIWWLGSLHYQYCHRSGYWHADR